MSHFSKKKNKNFVGQIFTLKYGKFIFPLYFPQEMLILLKGYLDTKQVTKAACDANLG